MLQTTFSWTDDARAEAVEMWEDGRTITEIADFFSISRGSVAGFISRNRSIFPERKVTRPITVGNGRKQAQSGKTSWTPDRVETASAMWKQGRSARDIGDALGTTDQAVARYAADHRDLFPKRQGVGAKQKATRSRSEVVRIQAIEKDSPLDFSGYRLPDVQPISFLAIGRGECRWPISCDDVSGPDMLCCGAETGGMVYCPTHASISRGRGTEGERSAVKDLRRAA